MVLNEQRAKRWADAMGIYRQGRCHFVERDARGLKLCWLGVGAMCAAADGYVRMVDQGYGPRFQALRCGEHTPDVYGALAHWLGVGEVWDIRVRLADLPYGLRCEVEVDLAAERARRPLIAHIEKVFEDVSERGHPLWLLNDCQVHFATLADVMRVALAVDAEAVPA